MDTVVSRGEVTLWRAVIHLALSDATPGATHAHNPGRRRSSTAAISGQRLLHMREARNWLLGMSQDFCTVCDSALLDPMAVRATAKKAIAACDMSPSQANKNINPQENMATKDSGISLITGYFMNIPIPSSSLSH